jgi:DNA-binding XRE family transcriptional regulator
MMHQPVDWTQYAEPWRSIGPEFAEECWAICAGNTMSRSPTLGERLRAVRTCRRMTQKAVAAVVGCSMFHLGRIERGQWSPKPQLRARIKAFVEG